MISALRIDAGGWSGAHALHVVLTGEPARRIRPEIDPRSLPDIEHDLIDPVVLLAAAAAHGLFSGQAGPTRSIRAEAHRITAPTRDAARWTLRLDNVDVGALRLLAAMARYVDAAALEIADDGRLGDATTPATALPFPPCTAPQEFAFDYQRPTKSRGERGVRLTFAEPPDDATLTHAIAALDQWAAIVMAGAYAAETDVVGALADPAGLEESCVVGLALPICVGMNELMFAPLVNLARRLHALHAPLERLEIL